jgi:hypothetical protein
MPTTLEVFNSADGDTASGASIVGFRSSFATATVVVVAGFAGPPARQPVAIVTELVSAIAPATPAQLVLAISDASSLCE